MRFRLSENLQPPAISAEKLGEKL
jgi:hypothetical protein